jgi:hypothetical protein
VYAVTLVFEADCVVDEEDWVGCSGDAVDRSIAEQKAAENISVSRTEANFVILTSPNRP